MWCDLAVATIMLIGFGHGDSQQFTRVRSTQAHTTTLLREAYDRSSSFRSLVDTLQKSNATVVVRLGACKGGRIRSCVISVNGSERARHIWIKVDPHTTHDRLLAAIAHELQHAVEIVEQPDVFDAESVLRLYRNISFGKCREGLSEECETERALATERRVLEELHEAIRGTRTHRSCPYTSGTRASAADLAGGRGPGNIRNADANWPPLRSQ